MTSLACASRGPRVEALPSSSCRQCRAIAALAAVLAAVHEALNVSRSRRGYRGGEGGGASLRSGTARRASQARGRRRALRAPPRGGDYRCRGICGCSASMRAMAHAAAPAAQPVLDGTARTPSSTIPRGAPLLGLSLRFSDRRLSLAGPCFSCGRGCGETRPSDDSRALEGNGGRRRPHRCSWGALAASGGASASFSFRTSGPPCTMGWLPSPPTSAQDGGGHRPHDNSSGNTLAERLIRTHNNGTR